MSSKKALTMKKHELKPRLRFPEFRDAGEWQEKTLGEISNRILKKVGTQSLETISISAGVGFVAQAKKFSRDISGEQYKNYIVLNEGDFSYNKGNSKRFPQGCVYKLTNFKQVAAPNVFFSFRFKNDYVADFYQGYFANNFHGEQLKNFITSGARSNGLLNLSSEDFFSIKLPTPSDRKEQQRIADCLSSIDDLITTQSQKLDALKLHKKGLMQQLFPAAGETVPRLRFPEFRDAGEWEEKTISSLGLTVTAGATPSTTNPKYWGGNIRWMNSGELNLKRVYDVENRISKEGLEDSSTKLLPKFCVLVGLAGQGKTRGTVAMNMIELCTNQSIAAIHPSKKMIHDFLYHELDRRYEELRGLAAGDGGRGGLNLQIIKNLKIKHPKQNEQMRIANCLSSFDDLIVAQSQKLDALKLHKKGLMQQLFPTPDEVKE